MMIRNHGTVGSLIINSFPSFRREKPPYGNTDHELFEICSSKDKNKYKFFDSDDSVSPKTIRLKEFVGETPNDPRPTHTKFDWILYFLQIVFLLPVITLIRDITFGGIYIITVLGTLLQLEGPNSWIFGIISVILFHTGVLILNIYGSKRDLLVLMEKRKNNPVLSFLRLISGNFERCNPFTGELTYTKLITLSQNDPIMFSYSNDLILDLDKMANIGGIRRTEIYDVGSLISIKREILESSNTTYKVTIYSKIRKIELHSFTCSENCFQRVLKYFQILLLNEKNLFTSGLRYNEDGVDCLHSLSIFEIILKLSENSILRLVKLNDFEKVKCNSIKAELFDKKLIFRIKTIFDKVGDSLVHHNYHFFGVLRLDILIYILTKGKKGHKNPTKQISNLAFRKYKSDLNHFFIESRYGKIISRPENLNKSGVYSYLNSCEDFKIEYSLSLLENMDEEVVVPLGSGNFEIKKKVDPNCGIDIGEICLNKNEISLKMVVAERIVQEVKNECVDLDDETEKEKEMIENQILVLRREADTAFMVENKEKKKKIISKARETGKLDVSDSKFLKKNVLSKEELTKYFFPYLFKFKRNLEHFEVETDPLIKPYYDEKNCSFNYKRLNSSRNTYKGISDKLNGFLTEIEKVGPEEALNKVESSIRNQKLKFEKEEVKFGSDNYYKCLYGLEKRLVFNKDKIINSFNDLGEAPKEDFNKGKGKKKKNQESGNKKGKGIKSEDEVGMLKVINKDFSDLLFEKSVGVKDPLAKMLKVKGNSNKSSIKNALFSKGNKGLSIQDNYSKVKTMIKEISMLDWVSHKNYESICFYCYRLKRKSKVKEAGLFDKITSKEQKSLKAVDFYKIATENYIELSELLKVHRDISEIKSKWVKFYEGIVNFYNNTVKRVNRQENLEFL